MNDAYKAETVTHNGLGRPRGPIAQIPENAPPMAIGFCPLCKSNARKTCSSAGMFDCPTCTFVWYDDRVGEKTRQFEDYFSHD